MWRPTKVLTTNATPSRKLGLLRSEVTVTTSGIFAWAVREKQSLRRKLAAVKNVYEPWLPTPCCLPVAVRLSVIQYYNGNLTFDRRGPIGATCRFFDVLGKRAALIIM
jgi:hypothetical protein